MIVIVPADHVYVVERLGRYHRTANPGLHVLVPLVDRVAFRFTLRPQDLALSDTCITFDNVPFAVTSTIRWQIADAQTAAYAVANPAEFVTGLVRSCQREWIGKQPSKDVRETTRELEQAVLRAAAEPAAKAGVKVVGVDVTRIERVRN